MKKVLASSGKGSTFAPAFGREAGLNGGETEAKFFESLRPAQDQRGGSRARQGTLLKEHQREHQGGTRDSEEKFEKNNITTKSLILAQDER